MPRPQRPHRHDRSRQQSSEAPRQTKAAETAWDDQAAWYDARHGDDGDAVHAGVVLPAVLRLLDLKPGQRVLDCCCGQGVLARAIVDQGASVCGVDASPALIAAAEARAVAGERYLVGDARDLAASLSDEAPFDAAAVVLALQDLDPMEPVLVGLHAHVQPGAPLVVVVTHPCFRVPQASDWGWHGERRFRRVSRYAAHTVQIRTRPGGGDAASSQHFHRPLQAWISSLGQTGWAVDAAEELTLPNRGSRGTRAAEEDRTAREFPVFLALRARALPAPGALPNQR